ncbi:FG-GAP repeat domain-containing protein [Nocardia sp. NPDC052566]|uniref:FG-GAP repeat domain-containing protein n=1 Tax=Nocardia sp. NPDC052566 TaxID=3364330 RepID=UPI0037C58727
MTGRRGQSARRAGGAVIRAAILAALLLSAANAAVAHADPMVFGPNMDSAGTVCGNSPTAEAIAVADFTGEGIPDLALTDFCGFGVNILPGRGDGTLGAPQHIWTGVLPDALTAADLDGDGDTDLIVSNAATSTMTVRYGDGHGGFPDQRTYQAPGLVPGAARTGDFDRDGQLDFAVAATPSAVFHNSGDRSFVGHPVLAGVLATGLEVADFDRDRNLDLVVLSGAPLVNIAYGKGDGTFGRNDAYLAPALVQEAMRVADVNGDGLPDVVSVNSLGGMNVWLGNGYGVNAPIWSYGTFGNAGLALADLDGDGRLDMVTADSVLARITVYRGDGAGHFSRAESHSAPWLVESLELADLNGDGKPDMVTGPMLGPWYSVRLHT